MESVTTAVFDDTCGNLIQIASQGDGGCSGGKLGPRLDARRGANSPRVRSERLESASTASRSDELDCLAGRGGPRSLPPRASEPLPTATTSRARCRPRRSRRA